MTASRLLALGLAWSSLTGVAAARQIEPQFVWRADGDQVDGLLGWAVASAGDVNDDGYDDVIVGSIYHNGVFGDEGRVQLYLGSASGPSETSSWSWLGGQYYAEFGFSVAAAGDVNGDGYDDVIIGADRFDSGQQDEGRAFVFLGNSTGLSASPSWTAESDLAFAQFGTSVAGAGDVNGDGYSDVVVGALDGPARLYQGSASGLSVSPNWMATSGSSVAGAGDVNNDGYGDVIVGDPVYSNGQTREGRASLFLGSSSGLSATPIWNAEGNQAEALFGTCVASAGDVNGDGFDDVVVGAPDYVPDEEAGGLAFVYMGSASGLGALATSMDGVNPGDLGYDNDFGYSVATAGDVNGDGYDDVIVGDRHHQSLEPGSFAFYEGGAFVYLGSAVGLSSTYSWWDSWSEASTEAYTFFGRCVAGAGDVNGDGLSDVIVGAPFVDIDFGNGAALVYQGSSPSGTVLYQQTISGATGGFSEPLDDDDAFGAAVAPLGDLDSDGIADMAVGAFQDDDGGANRGAVRVLFLDETGAMVGTQKISASAGGFSGALDDGDSFGGALATLGDLDGDGIGDLAVGAPGDDDGGTSAGADRGAVWILFLNADGTVKASAKISDTAGGWSGGLEDGDGFGCALTALEDLDGDGVTELAVGADADDDGGANQGAVWILFLDDDGTVKSEQKISETSGAPGLVLGLGDAFGRSLTSLGDLDGDGIGELAVGASGSDDGGVDRGSAWILFLNNDGTAKAEQKISQTAGTFRGTLGDGDESGGSLASLGDLNGDGIGELALGASRADDGGLDQGAVWVLFLRADGTVQSELRISDTVGGLGGDLEVGDRFGSSLSSLGDLDGDGIADLAVGAMGDDDGGSNQGAVSVLFLEDFDSTAPTISAPDSVTVVDKTGSVPGEVVFFSVTATDVRDLAPSVTCMPPSSSFFPRGTTTVTCTATDASGNQSFRAFPVVVLPKGLRNPPKNLH